MSKNSSAAGLTVEAGRAAGLDEELPSAGFAATMKSTQRRRSYVKPGTYIVKVNGIDGCAGSATRTVEVL